LATTAKFESRAQTDEVPPCDPFFENGLDVSGEVVELQPARGGLKSLREQYLHAARRRSELMDEESLRQAIAGEEKSVAELYAQKSLDNVEQQLLQISSEFSETVAGSRASVLLQNLATLKQQVDQQGNSFFPVEPVEAPFFESRQDFRRNSESKDFDMFDADKPSANAICQHHLPTPSANTIRPSQQPSIPNVAKPRNDGAFFSSPEVRYQS